MALVLCTGVDPVLMETRRLILESAGHTVIFAKSEPEVEKECSQHQFDVAVIGQSLSAKVKPRVLSLIRASCPSVAVLELHPQYSKPVLQDADAWLAMPALHPQELLEAVNSLARKQTSDNT